MWESHSILTVTTSQFGSLPKHERNVVHQRNIEWHNKSYMKIFCSRFYFEKKGEKTRNTDLLTPLLGQVHVVLNRMQNNTPS